MSKESRLAVVELSVVVPVRDEEAVLPGFFARLYPVLDRTEIPYEVVLVDGGSRDRSPTLLRQQHTLRPDTTRVLLLRGEVGRQSATMAGLDVSRGRRVVTLDAGLRGPPEEIPRLLAELDRGHDYVGGIRRGGQDARWRNLASDVTDRVRERLSSVKLTDPGCTLRAYDREIVDALLASWEGHAFIPALASRYAVNPTEIEVDRDERAVGESMHSPFGHIQLHLELMTGYSATPLHVFSLAGIGISLVSILFGIYLVVRRLVVGLEEEGVFTLVGILFVLLGVILLGVGVLGAYVGRMYDRSRGRPGYLVWAHLRPSGEGEGATE